MEAKVTSTRKLEVYPSKHNKEIETAETIFIEDILKLKNEGDSILLTRRNASGLSCLAYLESRPVEKLAMPKIADYNKLLDLREKLVWGDILECYDKDELKKYVNENYKSKDIGLNEIGKKILAELEHMKYL